MNELTLEVDTTTCVMPKVIKDGMVAVLYSPGFGAGWSTWADDAHKQTMTMDARIVQPMIDGDRVKAIQTALDLCPDVYVGGGRDLTVVWLPVGTAFWIDEYDGSESIQELAKQDYMVA